MTGLNERQVMGNSCDRKKNVLITGCSSGIGRTLALDFENRGYRVWATARRLESIQNLAEKNIFIEPLDVTCEEQVKQVVERIMTLDGHLDVLVNNAGYGSMGPLIEVPKEELEQQFATNVFAPMALIRAVAPSMCARRQGMIVNIGSVSGVLVTPFSGSYCASKAAFNSLSDALRMELKPFGVQVITVQPGAVRSRFADNASDALDRVLKPDSLYIDIEEGLRDRARASQKKPTEAEVFCRQLIDRLESGRNLTTVRLAYGSWLFPQLDRWVPTRLLERILSRLFRLNQLK